jgi:hypothetical protein
MRIGERMAADREGRDYGGRTGTWNRVGLDCRVSLLELLREVVPSGVVVNCCADFDVLVVG